MRATIRVLLALALALGAVVGGVGAAIADPVLASSGYTISGNVYSVPGVQPFDDVEIGLYQSDGAGGWSRINWVRPFGGAYEFSGVAAGTYRIGAEPPANASSPLWRYQLPYFRHGASTVESATDLIVASDVMLSSIAILENARVSGTIRSAVDSAPIAGAAVTLYWFSGPGAYRTDTVFTGPLGEYVIYVPSGAENSFSLRFAKPGYLTEFFDDKATLEQAELRGATSWEGLDASLRARITASVRSSISSFRGTGRTRITTTLKDSRTGQPKPNAQFRLQRSYNGRTWSYLGGVLKTDATGRHVALSSVSRTTYFRAVPVSSSKYLGVTSAWVRVLKR